ncbi:hypothetical protein BDR05DRAFT_969986, partial [Suillus weaverae]
MKTGEHENIVFEPEDIAGDRREYNKVHKNVTVVVELSRNPTTEQAEQLASSSDETLELLSTTDEISRKFRILAMGKTGIGKSSLINHAFGVQTATTSHEKPGEASVDHEFISPQNDRFVLHNSKGFETRSEDNFKIVRDFIDCRRTMPYSKDRLHAVWLCFEIPRTGGRLLETGVEQFLTSKREGELGNIPIVVVVQSSFHAVDVERTLDKSTIKFLSKAAIQELNKNSAKDKLQERNGCGIPHVTVSINNNHEETLARLIQTTEELVYKHVGTDAS